jgi:hypothetical protein
MPTKQIKKLAIGAHGVLGVRPDRERDADAHDQTESRVAPIDEDEKQVRSGRHYCYSRAKQQQAVRRSSTTAIMSGGKLV